MKQTGTPRPYWHCNKCNEDFIDFCLLHGMKNGELRNETR